MIEAQGTLAVETPPPTRANASYFVGGGVGVGVSAKSVARYPWSRAARKRLVAMLPVRVVSRPEAVGFGHLADAIEKYGLADATETDQHEALGMSVEHRPLDHDFRLAQDLVAACELRRRVAGAGCKGVTSRVHVYRSYPKLVKLPITPIN